MTVQAPLRVIEETGPAAVVLHPIRQRLLRELAEPDSASGVARRIGLPRQKINYHLRELEREGFLELVEERRKGNCIERVVRASARSYLISPEVLGSLGRAPGAAKDRFSPSYLIAVMARLIRDVATLRRRRERDAAAPSTLVIESEVRFVSPKAQEAFADEVTRAIGAIVTRYHDGRTDRGRLYRLVIGAYPAADEAAPAPAPVSASRAATTTAPPAEAGAVTA